MLHQALPLYEGNQPFIYACYCAEDDDIAFPVLARMYNEGFRIWCASAGDIEQDYRTIQRMNACATVMIFLSRNMLELLRIGDPEAVAAAKSPRLHITVSIDGSTADRSMWALSVPDALEYNPSGDAAFWLYMYTSEKLEKCRGPWPEKKIKYREAGFDFLSERAVQDEYEHLETIISSDKPAGRSEPETVSIADRAMYEGGDISDRRAAERYPNNPGYIQPQPDEYVYLPLDRLEVTKSESEKEFDAFIGYLDKTIEAEERSMAEQLADIRYISGGKKTENPESEKEKAEPEQSGQPENTEKPQEAEQPVPVPEITPRFSDPAERAKPPVPVPKEDITVPVDEHLSLESLNPEARRRRMYEGGKLDKVLDPNDIDAIIQRRKKEEREKAEERQRAADEAAAKQAAMLLEKIDGSEKTSEDSGAGSGNDEAVSDSAESLSDAQPSGDNARAGEKSGTDGDMAELSEESLESIIDSSDPRWPGGMPSSEQLAAAPTYVMVPPSDGTNVDAPTCLKLIEAEGGMIAVPAPMPEEPSDQSASDTGIRGIISDMFPSGDVLGGSEYSEMGRSYDSERGDNAEKKRHTTARKVVHRREGVKVTPVKFEILHKLPRPEKESMPAHTGSHRSALRNADSEDAQTATAAASAEVPAARTAMSTAENVSADDIVQGGRKYRSRPAVVADEAAAAEPVIPARAAETIPSHNADSSMADAVMDEFETRQSHRKNRHPHSQSGLLANLMAMLSRGADLMESVPDEEAAVRQPVYDSSDDTASSAPVTQGSGAQNAGHTIPSLSAAVEKFIEVAPLEPVMVVPRRK